MESVELVRMLYESYQERDWERATSCLHPEAEVDMPATGERLDGRDMVIDFQRSYPEPWGTLSVGRAYGDGDGAVAEVHVVDPSGQRFAMAGFWTRRDGLLHHGLELWVDVGGAEPGPNRADLPTTQAARQAGGSSPASGLPATGSQSPGSQSPGSQSPGSQSPGSPATE